MVLMVLMVLMMMMMMMMMMTNLWMNFWIPKHGIRYIDFFSDSDDCFLRNYLTE